jgi:hypothetical protein
LEREGKVCELRKTKMSKIKVMRLIATLLLTFLLSLSCDSQQSSSGYVLMNSDGTVRLPNGSITPAMLSQALAGSYRTLVTLNGNVVNNNASANTIADVTGLSFQVTAGTTYRFYALIRYSSAATTTGSRWSVSAPANPTLLNYVSRYTLTATAVTTNNATAYDVPSGSSATSLTAGNICVIEGIITPSQNGTFIIRFASEVSNSAITALAGSTLEYW